MWERSLACVSYELEGKEENVVPAMPTVLMTTKPEHRPKNVAPLFNAAVARPVTKREIAMTPAAVEAMHYEWE